MDYSIKSINLNGKEITLDSIRMGSVTANTDFEKSTLDFIRDWTLGVETFNINTSGSTGVPKPITITRHQMAASASMTLQALQLKAGDAALVCLNTQFIAGKMMLVRSLVGNLRIVAVEPASNPLKNVVQAFDFVALIPLQIQHILLSAQKSKLDYIKAILVGGGAISHEQHEMIKTIKSPVFATYGMTETISHIALQSLNNKSSEAAFNILPGIQISTDERNCLVIEAPFLQGKIHTNDIVQLHDPKSFTWLGRLDNVINTGGIKVFPEKVERDIQGIMSSLNFYQPFFIGSQKDAFLGEKIILITEGRPDEKWGEILTLHKQSFSKYESPKEIHSTNKFIYTATEKIDRKATLKATMA